MSAAIKRTLSTGSDGSKSKFPRRQSEETHGIIGNNNAANHCDRPSKLGNNIHIEANDKNKTPSKKIKKEPLSEDSDEGGKDKKNDESGTKKTTPIKYPFRYLTFLVSIIIHY